MTGAGLPGAEEVRQASWIQTRPNPSEPRREIVTACAGRGAGERSAIYLASSLRADLILIDEVRVRRVGKALGLSVAGSIAILERGARSKKVDDLRSVYLNLLEQGIRFDRNLLNDSLLWLGLPKL